MSKTAEKTADMLDMYVTDLCTWDPVFIDFQALNSVVVVISLFESVTTSRKRLTRLHVLDIILQPNSV